MMQQYSGTWDYMSQMMYQYWWGYSLVIFLIGILLGIAIHYMFTRRVKN